MDTTLSYNGKQVLFTDPDPTDYVEGHLCKGIWWELPALEFIRDLNVTGNYVDVGAYVGTHTLYFSMFTPATKVYAIEPQADMFAKLVDNLAANQITNCVPKNIALSSVGGRAATSFHPGNRGGAQLLPGKTVAVKTLDSLKLKDVKLLKIDVEGAELQVLAGARKTLASVDHLFVEYWPQAVCAEKGVDYTGDRLATFLEPFGLTHHAEIGFDLHYFTR